VQFLLLGAIVGVMAGLLGIGGGLIVVPVLSMILPHAGIPPGLSMHISLATSLATIIVTSGSSVLNHLRYGNVDMFVIKWLVPGVVCGGFIGASLADWMPQSYLSKVFGVIVLMLAIQMFRSLRPHAPKPMPGAVVTSLSGAVIGIIASLAGIGGGALSVPFLNRHGVEMRKAVGSSSLCGCIIAISGMLGFIWHGASVENLPKYSLGYVYLPALLFIAVTSMFMTKLGAKLTMVLPTAMLKKIFSVFLMFVSVNMLLR
jgi:uncharacterized membrane protein YfcA